MQLLDSHMYRLSMTRFLKNLPAPIYEALSFPISSLMLATSTFLFKTLTIIDAPSSTPLKSFDTPVIFTMWHGHLPFLMVHHGLADDTRTLLVSCRTLGLNNRCARACVCGLDCVWGGGGVVDDDGVVGWRG